MTSLEKGERPAQPEQQTVEGLYVNAELTSDPNRNRNVWHIQIRRVTMVGGRLDTCVDYTDLPGSEKRARRVAKRMLNRNVKALRKSVSLEKEISARGFRLPA